MIQHCELQLYLKLCVLRYGYPFEGYFLVQFIEDNIKTVVKEKQVTKEDNGATKAMYSDKQYYPCVILSESGKFFFILCLKFCQYKEKHMLGSNGPPQH